jgi:hypothetical protein
VLKHTPVFPAAMRFVMQVRIQAGIGHVGIARQIRPCREERTGISALQGSKTK